jgi:hypothetical protein
VIAGQNRAKSKGVKMGRPSKMNDGLKSAIQLLREKGMGIKQCWRRLNFDHLCRLNLDQGLLLV